MAKVNPKTPKPKTAPSKTAVADSTPRVPKVAIIILVIVAAITLLGIVGVLIGANYLRKHPEAAEEIGETLKQISDYPASYKQAGLPEYPSADITHFGDKDATFHDGIFIFLVTDDDRDKVAVFFDSQLKAKGWNLTNDNSSSDVYLARTYTKAGEVDDEDLKLGITRDNETNKTNVTINWTEAGAP